MNFVAASAGSILFARKRGTYNRSQANTPQPCYIQRISAERSPLEKALAAHPFLRGLSEDHIRLLAECAMQTSFAPNQLIFSEGETANRFYLIEKGRVELESTAPNGERVVIETIGAGDLLGWSWLFPPYIWNFSARAADPTHAIFFYGTILREYYERDKALGFELVKRMGEIITRRLQAARRKLLTSYAQRD